MTGKEAGAGEGTGERKERERRTEKTEEEEEKEEREEEEGEEGKGEGGRVASGKAGGGEREEGGEGGKMRRGKELGGGPSRGGVRSYGLDLSTQGDPLLSSSTALQGSWRPGCRWNHLGSLRVFVFF